MKATVPVIDHKITMFIKAVAGGSVRDPGASCSMRLQDTGVTSGNEPTEIKFTRLPWSCKQTDYNVFVCSNQGVARVISNNLRVISKHRLWDLEQLSFCAA